MRWLRRLDSAWDGVQVDVVLYALSAGFALLTALTSTLLPHRAWGAVATVGYAAAAVLALLLPRRPLPRFALAGATFAATALVPLLVQAVQRSGGRTDRAQEEVLVIEDAGRRLLETGTPYLDRPSIAALPEPLLGYMPYQPGMAVFGLPRGVAGGGWWSDARVFFAIVFVAVLAVALETLRRAGVPGPRMVRALQFAAVIPICALTLATGGDDLPVLGLLLLGLALAATGRWGWSGVAVGVAAALKLFAWPVLVVLLVTALLRRRPVFAIGAVGLPVLTAVPAWLLDRGALVENVLAFPFGRGLVTSPAASPLPGHLLATGLPGGRPIVYGLLVAAVVGIALWLVRRPPTTVARAALVCGVGMLIAMLLLPATRFGYLLYPVALLVWVPALAAEGRSPVDGDLRRPPAWSRPPWSRSAQSRSARPGSAG
jgi:glycosyl transferase family 87